MSLFPTRLPVIAILASVSLAAAGFAWEISRFGTTSAATRARLEDDVRRRFAERTRQVEWLAQQVAARSSAVAEAAASRDPSARLFTTLSDLANLAPYGPASLSATVYVVAGPGMYRVLAWSDGPAEDVPAERLSGSQQLFIAQGPRGPRLVSVKPIEREGRRIGVAAAEAVLSPPTRVGLGDYRFDTSFGPVLISQWYGGGSEPAAGDDRFLVSGPDGPLLEVQFSSAELADQRRAFRRRELAVAALPLVLALLLSSAPLLDRRRAARSSREFDRWSAAAAAAMLLGAVILCALATWVGAPLALTEGILGLAAVALAYLFPVSWWWRRDRRLFPRQAPARFAAEQILGGVGVGGALLAASWIAATRMPETALNRWHSSLFPIEGTSLLTISGIRLTELAIGWTAAALLAWLAARWRL
ncbi:MAG TPA: hypothetical protein VFO19_15795, partial [Vicinamibacterales bacterium]|nr:hypothetical protein [Vicinamibacterales bacterium]